MLPLSPVMGFLSGRSVGVFFVPTLTQKLMRWQLDDPGPVRPYAAMVALLSTLLCAFHFLTQSCSSLQA